MAYSIYEGEVLTYTTTSAVTNGALLIVGDTPAVALNAKSTGSSSISIATEGVFELTRKASAGNVGVGNKAYYVTTGGVNKVTSVATSGKCIGIYAETTTTGATTCLVRLIGAPLLVAV
jgi:predicted RecA/RadA family phage recombinase